MIPIKKIASWGIVVGGLAVLGEAIAKLKTTSTPVTIPNVTGEIKAMASSAVASLKGDASSL